MSKPFAEVRALISHTHELRLQFSDDLNKLEKWKIEPELDKATGLYRHMFRVLEPDDIGLKIKARGILGALRSSLDHVTAECVRLAGAKVTRDLQFPIAKTKEQVEKNIDRRCMGVPKEVRNYFLQLEPYEGGNPYLYDLNKLRNQAEHVQLARFVPSIAAIQILGLTDRAKPIIVDVPDGVKEVEITKSPFPEGHYGVSILFAMPFDGAPNISPFGFDPIIRQVEIIVDETEKIMDGLGLIPH